MDKSRYVAIVTKMGLALLEDDEPHDIEEARQNAREAWQDDSRGRQTLSRKRWLDSVFELADTVCIRTRNSRVHVCTCACMRMHMHVGSHASRQLPSRCVWAV